MWKITATLLYISMSICDALESNSSLVENKALPAEGSKFVGKEELQYVVSLGVFKDGNYIHICLAVMITGLNGITAGMCGHYEYYAGQADLIGCEENLAKEKRTKLHVNTKRPVHIDPDTLYTVIHFIDFDEYLFDKTKGEDYIEQPDLGVFVLKKEVQYTRPVLNVRMSVINEWSELIYFTLIGMSTTDDRQSGEKMLIKKSIARTGIFGPSRYSQSRAIRLWYFYYIPLTLDDLGGPVYLGDQYVGILVHNTRYAMVAIDAHLEKKIDKIIASTYFPRMNERRKKGRANASISNAILSDVNKNN